MNLLHGRGLRCRFGKETDVFFFSVHIRRRQTVLEGGQDRIKEGDLAFEERYAIGHGDRLGGRLHYRNLLGDRRFRPVGSH